MILFVVLCVLAIMVRTNMTPPSGLGVVDGQLAPMPDSPNAVSSQTGIAEKRVAPLPFKEGVVETRNSLKKALREYGNIEIIREEDNYIHAVSTSRFMRYNDDLEFYLDAEAALVHFRSASRIGYSDMGLNRSRYERLAELYE